jgi:hypothetical protein
MYVTFGENCRPSPNPNTRIARNGSIITLNGAIAKSLPYNCCIGNPTVAIKSVQLPTGSAINTSGRVTDVNRRDASTNELNRQQKHPPAISSTGNSLARAIAVSTNPVPWSFVINPTDRPCALKYRASFRIAVVFPAPRNPPIMMYRALL